MDRQSSSLAGAFAIIAVMGALAQWAVLWLTPIPLGVPGEWEWARNQPEAGWWLSLLPAILCGVLLIGFMTSVAHHIQVKGKVPRGGIWLLAALGFGWLLSVVSSAPGVSGLQRIPFVLFYERTSGYFEQAKHDAVNLPEFLRTYHQRISDSSQPANYLHQGTHPPGLTVTLWLLLHACESSPALTEAVLLTQPLAVREAFSVIAQSEAQSGRALTRSDAATLWLAAILVAAGSALTVFPVFSLARRYASVEAAWWAAGFWLLVPACGVFLPKSDVLFAGLAAGAMALWLRALDRRETLAEMLTGLWMFVCVNLSLAFAPIGLILLLQWAGRGIQKRKLPDWKPVVVSGLFFLLLLLLCWWWGNLNLLPIWRTNLSNHAEFYVHFTRTWWKWLLENPVELTFAVGAPLTLLATASLWRAARHRTDWRLELLIPWLVWAVLWLSGKNRGEAARLWILLMPLAAWTSALMIEKLLSLPGGRRCVAVVFIAQLILCAATVARVDGFHFADFR